MTEYQWTADSALWQVEHGEPGTGRTMSAHGFLTQRLDGCTCTAVAGSHRATCQWTINPNSTHHQEDS